MGIAKASRWFLLTVLLGVAYACSATKEQGGVGFGSGSGGSASGTGQSGGSGDGAAGLNLAAGTGGGGGNSSNVGPPVAFLKGKVLAPEGSIPINNALVYATRVAPPAIPKGVFCDKCIELGSSVPYILSAADGSFELGLPATGSWKIVTRKGAFRRVRTVEVVTGRQDLDAAVTTLPGRTDQSAGDHIPSIAVVKAQYDSIQLTLAKLGLGKLVRRGSADVELEDGSAQFTLYERPAFSSGSDNAAALFRDYTVLSRYQIVFFGCDEDWPDGFLTSSTVLGNLRKYVAAGGKLYVTDYSYDILKRAFEGSITWHGDNGSFGSAEKNDDYDAPATVNDTKMSAWLKAQNINKFTLEDNWTVVERVNKYSAKNEEGTQTEFTPKVWVSGDVPRHGLKPSTISFQNGCGRALFSTYHTESSFGFKLAPQELALLYIILEVNVCIGEIKPPPPR